MQPLASGPKLAAYHARLRDSHDFTVDVEILTLNEALTGNATFLDGQVNIAKTGPIRRTATLTLSDPAGALDFSNGSAWSNTHVWVDRLIRVRHTIEVPGYGEVTATAIVGVPTAISRSGAEVQVELADKAALAMRGARPYTAAKGTNAVQAIRSILSVCTGEFRFRFPSSTRRLSKDYKVGWADEAAPMVVAAKIADAELGMQLLYSCDGYALLRPLPSLPSADVGYVTEQANSQVDFTTLSNFALVTGGATSKKVGHATVTTRPQSTATVPVSSPISPERLKRNGVLRYLPLVVSEDGYKKTTQTAARAKSEIARAATIVNDLSANVVPFFHLDADDIVDIHSADTTRRTMRLQTGSIPLAAGGDMTIGYTAWVSRPAGPRVASHLVRQVKQPHKKHRKRHRAHH